jgi:hypothetical protein
MPPIANIEKVTRRTTVPARKCQPSADHSMPVKGAMTAKATTRMIETRLAIVIDSMSESAANAMQNGKTTKIAASSMGADLMRRR